MSVPVISVLFVSDENRPKLYIHLLLLFSFKISTENGIPNTKGYRHRYFVAAHNIYTWTRNLVGLTCYLNTLNNAPSCVQHIFQYRASPANYSFISSIIKKYLFSSGRCSSSRLLIPFLIPGYFLAITKTLSS